jgi:hypothetical protein
MRRVVLLSCACLLACGGASDAAKPKAANDTQDPGFAEYAATHGIQALEGGGAATEVTADGLRLEAYQKDRPVKMDGVLDEWPAPAKATVVTGSTKSGLKISLQYDDAKLYVGADIADDHFVAGKDHVSLVLAVPTPGASYATYDLGFYPGKPGDSEGTVRYGAGRGGRSVAGAKIVEAPSGAGVSFEATVPWASIPEARVTRVGIHGIATYVDGDGTIATGPGDAQHPHDMPWVPSEPELALIEQVLASKGYTKRAPDVELVADLTGDGRRERVAVWDGILTICGDAYLGGTAFFTRDIGGQLVKLEARDVTGRRGTDIIVRRKQSVGDAERQYLEVLSALSSTAEPAVTFAHEIEIRQSDKRIDNAVKLGRGLIEVSVEPTTTWDALSYKEPIASDVEPILFPWGGVRAQTYKFDGSKFAKAKEVTQRDQTPSTFVASTGGGGGDPVLAHPPEPPTPKVSKGGDMSGALLAQYRQDRGVPASVTPKVDLKVQVSGDGQPERVLLVGRDIVVFGPGFKGGTAYAYLTLQQFASADDIDDLSARDLTGDGAADLVVRGTRHVKSDSGTVDEESLFVYQVGGDAITRIFGIETGREMGHKRIQGLVQFIPAPGGKSFDILAAPGRATGWTEKTYPWAQDQPGSGAMEPLLLPWGGIPSVRYTWSGGAFTRSGG